MWCRPRLASVLLWLAATVVSAQNDGGLIFIFPEDDVYETTTKPPSPRPTVTNHVYLPPPPTVTNHVYHPVPLQQSLPSNKSLQMCRKYAKSVFSIVELFDEEKLTLDSCAIVEPLIVNGTVSLPREFPHMALIGMQNSLGHIKWRCGGSLISERFVLSAAHCNPLNPKRVRLGDHNIRSTEDDDNNESRPVEFNIIRVIQHPEYDEVKNYNDITLYELDKNVEMSEYIRPICLHTSYDLPTGYGIVTGWGNVEFSGRSSDTLLKGNVSYISAPQCAQALNPSLATRRAGVRDDIMICAANFDDGTDTCQGDSGGPLQYRLSDPYCMYSQVGITSFGIRCASNFPAIYTRVSHYVPWIESIVWP